ncbi:hypothetical protein KOR42_53570 [Thalassoglobus neptunius]|uniref:Uncharacterized protein n=1 Tax=Thalassoglobus neptunius TaxID=1938619 RepID=A0A5C5V8S6_9PLAN|nr:hypothetical protein [Thalassoglobus neptunius]TWT34978.1 hypothetical protein KOR42_53570 [Thalassoglobus neptunius]
MTRSFLKLFTCIAATAIIATFYTNEAAAWPKGNGNGNDGGGGGGSGGPVPPGVIYFSSAGQPREMLADGSQELPAAGLVASYRLHSSERFFAETVYQQTVDRNYFQIVVFSSSGTVYLLTDDESVYIRDIQWAKDDSFIAGIGEIIGVNSELSDKEYFFMQFIDWSQGFPSSDGELMILPMDDDYHSYPFDTHPNFDVSPDGTQIV